MLLYEYNRGLQPGMELIRRALWGSGHIKRHKTTEKSGDGIGGPGCPLARPEAAFGTPSLI